MYKPIGQGPKATRGSFLLKGLLLTAAPLALQAVFLAVLLWNGRASLAVEQEALHSREVIGQAESALLLAQENRLGRSALAELLAEEQRLDRERVERLAATHRQQRALLLGGLAAAAAVGLCLAWAFARSLGSSLAVVAANVVRMEGNASLPAPLRGRGGIAQLDRTLHQTARRLAEVAERTRQHERELERHSADLVVSNQDLRSKSQEVEMFVYSVSHDLRSPLVNLQGFSRELEHSLADLQLVLAPLELTPQVRARLAAIDRDLWEALHFIVMAVSRSRTIIDALLRLARAGRVDYRWRLVMVGEVVRRVIDAMRGTIEEKGARITVGELPPAWGDPAAVEQIFDNLLNNALRYLDPARPGIIDVGAVSLSPGGQATYWVRDNGRGIPDVCVERLFVPFQRFHGDVAQGEGIGLALVRRAVERHGGHIHAESREGAGTTFFLTLPAAAGGSAA